MVNKYSDLSERDKQATLLERMDAAKTAIENMPTGDDVIAFSIDENGKAERSLEDGKFVLPEKVKDLGDYAFYHVFYEQSKLTSVDMSHLTTVSGFHSTTFAFYNCTNLTSVDLSSLTTISGSYGVSDMFGRCDNLISADLSSLTTISGSYGAYGMFSACTNLTSVDLSSLTTISGNSGAGSMFDGCTNLASVVFSSLATVTGNSGAVNMFRGCTSLKELRFPALTASSFGTSTNQFSGLLRSVTGCTVHFPAAAREKIEKLSTYPNFGGTNTVVLFDL